MNQEEHRYFRSERGKAIEERVKARLRGREKDSMSTALMHGNKGFRHLQAENERLSKANSSLVKKERTAKEVALDAVETAAGVAGGVSAAVALAYGKTHTALQDKEGTSYVPLAALVAATVSMFTSGALSSFFWEWATTTANVMIFEAAIKHWQSGGTSGVEGAVSAADAADYLEKLKKAGAGAG